MCSPRRRWTAAVPHGFAINGLVARDSLLLEEDEDEFEVVVETIETEILEPWRQARDASGDLLYLRVSEYDPGAAAFLREGWHIVALPGPASLSSASNASLEALTRTLRVAAPDDAVRLWAAEDGGLDLAQVEHDGRVKRSARVRYLMRGRKKERKLVMAQIQALVRSTEELTGRLNAGKHASVGDMRTAQTNLMVSEAVLSALLSDVSKPDPGSVCPPPTGREPPPVAQYASATDEAGVPPRCRIRDGRSAS